MSAADREWLREMFDGPARDVAALPEWARPVVTPPAGSPGTYGPTPPRHPWTGERPDPGLRLVCAECKRERRDHDDEQPK